MCTKQLIATDCMEYAIECTNRNPVCPTMYIGLKCSCSECLKYLKATNNLTICPICHETLQEIK